MTAWRRNTRNRLGIDEIEGGGWHLLTTIMKMQFRKVWLDASICKTCQPDSLTSHKQFLPYGIQKHENNFMIKWKLHKEQFFMTLSIRFLCNIY